MNRLTKGSETHNGKFVSYIADVSLYPEMMGYEYVQADMDCINKLGELEDIEEELGISLLILFKALKNGIYFETPHNFEVYVHGNALMIDMETKQIKWNYAGGKANLKDYGKTWALCEEDLKDE